MFKLVKMYVVKMLNDLIILWKVKVEIGQKQILDFFYFLKKCIFFKNVN